MNRRNFISSIFASAVALVGAPFARAKGNEKKTGWTNIGKTENGFKTYIKNPDDKLQKELLGKTTSDICFSGMASERLEWPKQLVYPYIDLSDGDEGEVKFTDEAQFSVTEDNIGLTSIAIPMENIKDGNLWLNSPSSWSVYLYNGDIIDIVSEDGLKWKKRKS